MPASAPAAFAAVPRRPVACLFSFHIFHSSEQVTAAVGQRHSATKSFARRFSAKENQQNNSRLPSTPYMRKGEVFGSFAVLVVCVRREKHKDSLALVQ